MGFVKTGLKYIAKAVWFVTKAVTFLAAAFLLSGYGAIFHEDYLRTDGMSKVFLLRAREEIGPNGQKYAIAGTGFQVKAKSGKEYVLTNNHICDASNDGSVHAMNEAGKEADLKIVSQYDDNDLCLLEPVPGAESYSLADVGRIGDVSFILGHPRGFPLVITRGRVIGVNPAFEHKELLNPHNPMTGEQKPVNEKECAHKGYQAVEEIPDFMGMMIALQTRQFDPSGAIPTLKVCHTKQRIGIVDAKALPGSSGSPVVNAYNQVVGVTFAVDPDGYTYAVPLSQVKDFLSKY